MFDTLFNNALSKLEDTFSEMHYEVYFDKIANHFDEKWKEDMKLNIWSGTTDCDLHYIPSQGIYLISVEEVAQCQTLDKAFLFDVNKAVHNLNTSQEIIFEGGELDSDDQNSRKQKPRSKPKPILEEKPDPNQKSKHSKINLDEIKKEESKKSEIYSKDSDFEVFINK